MLTLVTAYNVHQLIALTKMNMPVYHFMVFGVFFLVLWNPEIVSLKVAWEKISDEKSENL